MSLVSESQRRGGTVIVTATDETMLPLVRRLITSLKKARAETFADIACLDVGLSPISRSSLASEMTVITPGWDLPVSAGLAEQKPYLRALTARPFLPRYFPGYETYLWIDADAWVQERFALDWYCEAAADGSLAITPEIDRCYRYPEGIWAWRHERLVAYFGKESAQKVLTESYCNAGVFALRGDAPHWQAWGACFKQGLERVGGEIVTDQTALNHAVWTEQLPVHPLPALCNWLCHLALPTLNPQTGLYQEPCLPYRTIGIVHATGDSKASLRALPA